MIEIVAGLPDGVVGFVAKGRVTKSDYDSVLIPKVKEAVARRGKVRCYYELGPEFTGIEPGAMWEDFKLGMEHLLQWERVAVVTDAEWIRIAISAFRFLVPGEIRVFSVARAAEARHWIVEK
jgi:hypothetical protein